MPNAPLRALVASLLLAGAVAGQSATPHWIWQTAEQHAVGSRRAFTLPAKPQRATLWATADNHLAVWLNGERVLSGSSWSEVGCVDVTEQLRAGSNVIAVRGDNDGGPAGIAVRLHALCDGSEPMELVSDTSWLCGAPEPDSWVQPEFDATGWQKATDLGAVDVTEPWNGSVTLADFARDPDPTGAQIAVSAEDITVAEGFRVERVYAVPRDSEGSWVALTNGPGGSLFASDQRGKGVFQIFPAQIGDSQATTSVVRVPVDVSHAQGLLWALDSLYVLQNGPDSGLYRVCDSDGDGSLDQIEQLTTLDGSGEHGPHAVVLAPDGASLFVACGNHTAMPRAAIQRSRMPMDWAEDLLLPRMWDARGHARGRLAPGGFICRVEPDGSNWEVISSGYRNQYDIAFAPDGELFTFDADMEWDMGMPWYRPTRICQVTSGSEFGWRAGSGKWPTYFADSMPAAVDIGPGSPTGIVFGTGSAFPARYARALFALDWTFGTIWAVHLEAEGAGFKGQPEAFVTGAPLPVTDAVVGADGALYFTTGGRGLPSSLYRVIATTPKDVAAASVASTPERVLRQHLEQLHGHAAEDVEQALATIWAHLGHRDRLVRYAARLALEAQPVDAWSARAVAETQPLRAAHALLALARRGTTTDQPALLRALDRIPLDDADDQVVLTALRAYGLAFLRQGAPDDATRSRVAARLDAALPSQRDDVDVELVRLLVYLRAPSVVQKALALIAAAPPTPAPPWSALIERNDQYGGPIRRMLAKMPPMRGLQFALMLRDARDGWTTQLRRDYFAFLRFAEQHPGGESYRGFIGMIRNEALAQCNPADRTALADLLTEAKQERQPPAPVTLAGPPRAWTVDDAAEALGKYLQKRDYERGRALFFSTSCAACHRFDGEGGQIGPDLTSAGNKFGIRDLLEAIIEPSKDISDQYGSAVVTRQDGSSLFGRVVTHEDGHLEVYLPAPGAPPVLVPETEVQHVEPSPISQMAPGLINMLNEEDLKDLAAYLLSRANAKDSMFR